MDLSSVTIYSTDQRPCFKTRVYPIVVRFSLSHFVFSLVLKGEKSSNESGVQNSQAISPLERREDFSNLETLKPCIT